ncbi:hypothetical protein [Halosimplex sp. J119]
MVTLTLDLVTEIERFEPVNDPSEEEAILHLRYHNPGEGLVKAGELSLVKSALPKTGRDITTQYDVTLTLRESARDLPWSVEDTRSKVGFRADYGGTTSVNAGFVLREIESTDYETWYGILDLAFDHLPDGKSLDFVDLSKEMQTTQPMETDHEHEWLTGKPYESNYVTLELDVSPGALDDEDSD